MDLPRSTYYDAPIVAADDAAIVGRIQAICDEFETYGYRRVGAALRQQGLVVNSKKVRRLMREHDQQPRRRRRFVTTTDSAHDLSVFPNVAREVVPNGPNQLWNGDITYVAVTSGFVYVALVLDAWSRRVVGYSIGRSIDARLVVAALEAAIASRRPPPGCICHTDGGSQRGVRGRQHRPAQVHRGGLQHPQTALCAGVSQPGAVRESTHPAPCQNGGLTLSTHRGALHRGVSFECRLTRRPYRHCGRHPELQPTVYGDVCSATRTRRHDCAVVVHRVLGGRFLSPSFALATSLTARVPCDRRPSFVSVLEEPPPARDERCPPVSKGSRPGSSARTPCWG